MDVSQMLVVRGSRKHATDSLEGRAHSRSCGLAINIINYLSISLVVSSSQLVAIGLAKYQLEAIRIISGNSKNVL